MTDQTDLHNLIQEIKQAKHQLNHAFEQKEQALETYKAFHEAYDQADRQYLSLMTVFEYCLAHDCDPAYAKLMLSDAQVQKSSGHGRGSKVKSLPQPNALYSRGESAPTTLQASRTFKQKVVDWMLKS